MSTFYKNSILVTYIFEELLFFHQIISMTLNGDTLKQ